MAFLRSLFGGSRGKVKQVPTMSPQQQALLNQLVSQQMSGYQSPLMQQGQSYLSSLFGRGPGAFSEYEAPILRQFNEDILPSIAERFAGVGGLSSSGFNQALGQAGASLAENLAAQRAGLRSDALQKILAMQQLQQGQQASLLGVSPFQNFYQPGQPGLLSILGAGAGAGLGEGFGKIGAARLAQTLFPERRFGNYGSALGGLF